MIKILNILFVMLAKARILRMNFLAMRILRGPFKKMLLSLQILPPYTLKHHKNTLKTVTIIGSICDDISGAPLEYGVAKSSLHALAKLQLIICLKLVFVVILLRQEI